MNYRLPLFLPFTFLVLNGNIALKAQEIKLTSANPIVVNYNEVVDFARLSARNIKEASTWYIEEAKASDKRINSLNDSKRTFENTIADLEQARTLLDQAASVYEVISSASPDKAIRDAATAASQDISDFQTQQNLDESLYKAVKAYAQSPAAKNLIGERNYYLKKIITEYERNGFALTPDKRDTLKKINNQIQELSIHFGRNIAQDNPTLTLTESEMNGVPADIRKATQQTDGSYKINVSNPIYIPFMSYAKNAEARKRVYLLKMNVAAPQNETLLAEILRLRAKKATLLGHETYADYATASIMSKNKKAVWDFENNLKTELRPKILSEYKELLDLKSAETGKKEFVIFPYDVSYYTTKLLDEKYKVDEDKVKEYFELQNVIKGLFAVYQRIYNLTFTEDKHPSVWHPDVQAFSVTDNATQKLIGYFYLDLYPRDNKYKHAACFPITAARTTAAGRHLASATLICNFPKPTADQPSLMPHSEVQTLFHEFGHLMHAMVSETELGQLSGTNVVTDFVEAPSQIMENWVWNKQVLSLFAKHYKTGEMIPSELLDKMIASKNATSGLLTLQQIFYGSFDFTLNDGFKISDEQSVSNLVKQIQNSTTLYPYVDGAHFECNFGHLTGYGSQYYGYLWSLVYAQDMFSVFAGDPLSAETGNRFRRTVLAKGGSDDAINLVKNFLGREPDDKAFLKNLGL